MRWNLCVGEAHLLSGCHVAALFLLEFEVLTLDLTGKLISRQVIDLTNRRLPIGRAPTWLAGLQSRHFASRLYPGQQTMPSFQKVWLLELEGAGEVICPIPSFPAWDTVLVPLLNGVS